MDDMDLDLEPAAENAEHLHELFRLSVRRATPMSGFSADAVAAAGRRRARQRRAAGVLGGTSAVALVAVGMSLAAGMGGSSASPTVRTGATPGTATTARVIASEADPGAYLAQERSTADQVTQVLAQTLGRDHLNWGSKNYPHVGDPDGFQELRVLSAHATWTADGLACTTANCAYAGVDIVFISPLGAAEGKLADPFRQSMTDGMSWHVISQEALPDGSMVDSAETVTGTSKMIRAVRTLQNGARLEVYVEDAPVPGRTTTTEPYAVNPVPYTESQLFDAVGNPALLLPYSDAGPVYTPSTEP